MFRENPKKEIEKIIKEFFEKMTLPASVVEVVLKKEDKDADVADVIVKSEEPQILIGQGGQTLFEIQKLLRFIINKKLSANFYLNLDINDYKKKKTDYLREFAREAADEVALKKEEKKLPAMPSYERRIIHAELAQRSDVTTESQGEGLERFIVIKPK